MITEDSNLNIKQVHNRQPVIIDEKDIKLYLNIEIDAKKLLMNRERPKLEFYEISKNVNKPNNNNQSLIQRI